MSKKVVIIGAGPVGLWTAIQIKTLYPEAEIIILEKYAEYKRKHPLRLEFDALNSMKIPEDSLYAKQVQELQQAILAHGNKKWSLASGSYINIRTSDLETHLKDTAAQLGIGIHNGEFSDLNTIHEDYQDCDYIIGADGAHSKVRKIVCNDEDNNTDRKTLKYVVEVKYEAKSDDEHKERIELKSLKTKYPTQKLMHFFADDYVGKPDADGKYPVSLRLFVDKETYESLGEAGFKNPKLIADVPSFPEKLREDIGIWLNTRKKYGESIENPDSIKITKLPLEVYKSKNFAKINEKGKFIGICGDAAGAVPYFRALNGGMERAAMLGQMIAHNAKNNEGKQELSDKYNSKMHRSLKWEIIRAIIKDCILKIVRFFIYISGCVPWQVNKWNRDERAELRNQDLFTDFIAQQNNKPPLLGDELVL